jgi:hypothetical protein
MKYKKKQRMKKTRKTKYVISSIYLFFYLIEQETCKIVAKDERKWE